MPVKFHPRPARCTNCGDIVLVVERAVGKIFGLRVVKEPTFGLEHADPGPNGELFDPVDDGCRRPRIGP